MAATHIVAIDQGTTSTRAIAFDRDGRTLALAQRAHRQFYPQNGWVEHDPEEIWANTVAVVRDAVDEVGAVAAIGITNQRETIIIWDRATGKPIHPAIVWQDRRTADACEALRARGAEAEVQAKTGLLIDPYFSATKIAWLLDHVPGARVRAERGDLMCGTIDSFLIWRLTRGAVHATDVTNASRTSLFDIHRGCWDAALLSLFDVPAAIMPEVRDSSGDFGTTDLFGAAIAITGVAGDQQAALFGQACFAPGMVKATYGTGCFMLMNTGGKAVASRNRLLTTPAWRIGGETSYAIEGSIFSAGASIQWLRDGLGLIETAEETSALAAGARDDHGVYLVPGFVGLGAPQWRSDVSGVVTGLTFDTGRSDLVRAALEAVAYQTHELMAAMVADGASVVATLRVDGGMAANDWLCAFIADIAGVTVERPAVLETTALGAAFLAGLAAGVWDDLDAIAATWACERRFAPTMAEAQRAKRLSGWSDAMRKALA